MKQSLQLKIGQSLTMTPQLQQAIKLLQLSNMELETEILEVLESNPLLEVETTQESSDSLDKIAQNNDQPNTEHSTPQEEKDSSDAINNDKIETELISDTQWEDWGYVSQSSSSKSESNQNYEYQGETSDSLREQLLWQINMTKLSDTDRTIAMVLIDSINDSGFMKADMEDIITMLNDSTDTVVEFESIGSNSIETDIDSATAEKLSTIENDQDDFLIGVEEIEAVLHLIQSFEPPGIAARSLQECLQIQLKRRDGCKENSELAKKIVDDQFELLANKNYRQILKNLKIDEQSLKHAIEIIQSLDPRPGGQLNQNSAQYIKPDVYVKKDKKGEWIVELRADSSPKLRVNSTYAALIKRADNSPDNVYLKNNLQDAKWFIKSLQSRNDTLLKVATSIVKKQNGFLDYGEEAMKPLVLHDIAEEVEMHESTISRVTTQKFLHTPKGIFELKYFFSSHVSTSSGGECSSTAIRAVIKKLVGAENQAKPLSDNKIALLLADQGIKVARRTVAKYRESLTIPPSNERKALV